MSRFFSETFNPNTVPMTRPTAPRPIRPNPAIRCPLLGEESSEGGAWVQTTGAPPPAGDNGGVPTPTGLGAIAAPCGGFTWAAVGREVSAAAGTDGKTRIDAIRKVCRIRMARDP